MSTSSKRASNKSDSPSDKSHVSMRRNILTVDQLFPSETNKSGTKGKRLDINTLFSGTGTNPDIVIDMSHEVLIQRRKQRRDDLSRQYLLEYKRCWEKIDSADKDRLTETTFEVLTEVERFPEFSPIECVELIQDRLRTEEFMDTIILDDNKSIYISWANVEANRDVYLDEQTDEKDKDDKSVSESDNDSKSKNDSGTKTLSEKEKMRMEFEKRIRSITRPITLTSTEKESDKDSD